MKVERTEAVVINGRDWRETSKIVTFYTRSSGKVTAIAKGARRKNSVFRDCLQPFTYLDLVYYEKEERELQVVSQCSGIDSFQDIREDLLRTAYASYFVQLIDEMVGSGEPSEELFRLLLVVLYKLRERSSDMLARFFELHLLEVLGYNPSLGSCAVCQDIVKVRSGELHLSGSAGGIVCGRCFGGIKDCRSVSGGVYSALLHLQNVDVLKLDRFSLAPGLCEELKSVVYCYLEYFLEKKLKSRTFLERIVKEIRGS